MTTPIKLGSEFQVNTETDHSQSAPSVAALSGGGFVVTWQSNDQDGGDDGIYGQRYNNQGMAVGSEFLINSHTPLDQNHPSAAGLSDGGFVVTWTSFGQDGSDQGVYGQRYDSQGAPVGMEFPINSYKTGPQQNSSVTGLSDGGFVVTWESFAQDGSAYGVFGQRYDNQGMTVGSEFPVNSHTPGNQLSASVTGLSDGGFVVTWESYLQDGDNFGVHGQLYDDQGMTVGSEFPINSFTTGNATP